MRLSFKLKTTTAVTGIFELNLKGNKKISKT